MEKGIPASLAALFASVVIEGGQLKPDREGPYIPASMHSRELFSSLINTPSTYQFLPDSFVVVDTGGVLKVAPGSSVWVLMARNELVLYPNSAFPLRVPYTRLVGNGHFTFTKQAIRTFLLANAAVISFYFIMQDGLITVAMLIFSIFFVAVAAYIFKTERTVRFRRYLKLACFASTPVFFGLCMNAMAGTRIQYVWHVFAFLSTIVMYRAVKAAFAADKPMPS
jgi:hypothetical protein